MSPDHEQTVLAALRAGKSLREVEAECGVSRSAVHRIAVRHGIVNGHAKALKAARPAKPRTPRPERPTVALGQPGTAGRDSEDVSRDSGTASVPTPAQHPAPVRPEFTIEERLHECTKAASRGIAAAGKCMERANKILDAGSNDSTMLHAAAALVDKAATAISKANMVLRINAGLPTAYEKSEAKTEGTMMHEYRTADEAIASAERVLGFGLDRSQAGTVSVPAPVPDGPQPS